MDRLEQYLDRVCRGVGGPRGLRQHVRQELREHLLDAVAGHQAAGLSEADALDRALADFGGPEAVGAELEATHGHRFLGVTIDTALRWKEATMRAKWFWATWTYVGLLGVIGLNLLFLAFVSTMILPKLHKLRADGYLNFDSAEVEVSWMYSYLRGVSYAFESLATWVLLGALAVWGLFEWRVRGENKGAMRQAALSAVALGLTAATFVAGGSMVIPLILGLPSSKIARPWAVETVGSIDASMNALEKAIPTTDWDAMRGHVRRAAEALARLEAGPAPGALSKWNEPPTGAQLRDSLTAAKGCLATAEQATKDRDPATLGAAVVSFRAAFAPVSQAAARAER
ncbi:MAG: permease prefix domain 1-containing protein [Gemmataceae bacterium]